MSEKEADLYTRLGSIEAKMDLVLSRDHATDKRLTALERFQNKLIGLAIGLPFVATYVINRVL